MPTTKFKLAEQALLRLKGGRPDLATKTDIRDIILAIPQLATQLLKASYFTEILPSGDTMPEGVMLSTYEDVPVTKFKNVSRSILPAMPVGGLPRQMGVFEISLPDNPYCMFIPALPGQVALMGSQKMISNLFNHVVYEPYGTYVQYNKDITKDGISSVRMRLVTTDISGLSDYDMLPITADMEYTIVTELFKQFGGQLPADEKTDVITDKSQAK